MSEGACGPISIALPCGVEGRLGQLSGCYWSARVLGRYNPVPQQRVSHSHTMDIAEVRTGSPRSDTAKVLPNFLEQGGKWILRDQNLWAKASLTII